MDEDITPSFPLTEDTLSFYAAHRLATIKYATFRGDLSALRSWHIDMGLPWDISGMRLLERVCRGARRFRGDPKSCSSKQRVTIAKLEHMFDFLNPADQNLMVIRTAFSTATQGLLRCGEFAVTGSLTPYQRWKALKEADVTMIPSWGNPTRMDIKIRASKTDPFRETVTVSIGRTNSKVDAVRDMRDMLMRRWGDDPSKQSDAYLFQLSDGSPLRRSFVIKALNRLTKACGFEGEFSGHSFRN